MGDGKKHYYSDKRLAVEGRSLVSMFKNGLEAGEKSVCLVSLKFNLYPSNDDQINEVWYIYTMKYLTT